MGLSYFDGAQFHAALKRGDVLAAQLFISAQGVDLKRAGSDGLTPLQLAEQSPKSVELSSLLRHAGVQ